MPELLPQAQYGRLNIEEPMGTKKNADQTSISTESSAGATLARARSRKLTATRRSEIARGAANAKWKNVGPTKAARRKAVAKANCARRKPKPETNMEQS